MAEYRSLRLNSLEQLAEGGKESMSDLLDKYIEQNKFWSFEGDRGVQRFTQIARTLGYSRIDGFLADNPGCIDAMVAWVAKQNMPEWKESLRKDLGLNEAKQPAKQPAKDGTIRIEVSGSAAMYNSPRHFNIKDDEDGHVEQKADAALVKQCMEFWSGKNPARAKFVKKLNIKLVSVKEVKGSFDVGDFIDRASDYGDEDNPPSTYGEAMDAGTAEMPYTLTVTLQVSEPLSKAAVDWIGEDLAGSVWGQYGDDGAGLDVTLLESKAESAASAIVKRAAEAGKKLGLPGAAMDYYTILVGGSSSGSDRLGAAMVKAGYDDGATSYSENAAFWKKLGISAADFKVLVKASL